MLFEKFSYELGNSTNKVVLNKCIMRKADQKGIDNIDISVHVTILEPLAKLRLQMAVFYKHEEIYKKFPIDLNDDVCAWLIGKKQSFAMELILKDAEQYVKYNGQLRCPLKGNLSIEFNNVSLNKHFPHLPFIPIGHYIFQSIFMEGDRRNVIAATKTYMEITDKIDKHF